MYPFSRQARRNSIRSPLRTDSDCIASTRRCRTPGGGPILAVGMSCFWHSLIGTDRHGNGVDADLHLGGRALPCRRRPACARNGPSGNTTAAPAACCALRIGQRNCAGWRASTGGGFGGSATGNPRRNGCWANIAVWAAATCARTAWRPAPDSITLAPWTGRMISWNWCGLRPVPSARHVSEEAFARAQVRTHVRRFPQLAGAQWWPAIGDGAAGQPRFGSNVRRGGRRSTLAPARPSGSCARAGTRKKSLRPVRLPGGRRGVSWSAAR